MKIGLMHQLVFLVLFSGLFMGCVGKIEDAAAPLTTEFSKTKTYFTYKGIIRASAIAHNKIELLFKKVDIDDLSDSEDNYFYKLYINDDPYGVEILPSTLSSNLWGTYYYIVENLQMNTIYAFTVRAFNRKTGAESQKEERVILKTMSNVVSDFMGISKVDLVPGSEASSVKVTFNRIVQPVEDKNPYSPVRIELYYETDPEKLMNMTKPSLTYPENTENLLSANYRTHFLVSGLKDKTKYFFRVRVVHRIHAENENLVYNPYDREKNTKYLAIETAPLAAIGNIKNPTQFKVQRANESLAYSQVQASWVPAAGSYKGYRLVYAKANLDFNAVLSDLSNKSTKDKVSGNIAVGPDENFRFIEDLTPGESYYFQLFLCRDSLEDCPLVDVPGSTTPKATGFDRVGPITVAPTLAAFTGINKIISPRTLEEFNNKQIILEFSPPSLSSGWADTMTFFCLSGNSEVELPTTQGSSCNGVYIPQLEATGDLPARSQIPTSGVGLVDFRSLILRGIQFSSTSPREYCFNATPVLNKAPFNITNKIYNENERKELRGCFYPEIKVPALSQFSGLREVTFDKNNREINLKWPRPSGGLFNKFVVFWKKKDKTFFNFSRARSFFRPAKTNNPISPTDPYGYQVFDSPPGDSDLISGTINSAPFDFGDYELGVLSLLQDQDGANLFWGQANASIKTVSVPVPSASFKSWTRIFAIGPTKTKVNADILGSTENTISEAIDEFGVPYRPFGNDGFVNQQPPGQKIGSCGNNCLNIRENGALFDGIYALDIYPGSREGIISLAWEEVAIEEAFKENFKTSQPDDRPTGDPAQTLPLAQKQKRKYGYKVYRSEDNGFTWRDLTPERSPDDDLTSFHLIYSRDYRHFDRPNKEEKTTRMVFFTDYSVKQATASTLRDRARVYWYRIEPYFNGRKVILTNPKQAMVKVTLPPPNMALVHRWMANRAQCLEMGIEDYKIDQHYTCDFTGLGAVPKKTPFESKQTKIDLGGDLLVDRYELGCNYTRGPVSATTQNTLFKDEKTSATDYARDYPGCYKLTPAPGELPAMSGIPDQISSLRRPTNDPSVLLIGDCLGEGTPRSTDLASIGYNRCPDQNNPNLRSYNRTTFAPGFNQYMGLRDQCETRYLMKRAGIKAPGDLSNYFDASGELTSSNPLTWGLSNYAQARPLSVFANIDQRPTDLAIYAEPVVGVKDSQLQGLSKDSINPTLGSNCAINLAAIYNNKAFSRWANLDAFGSGLYSYGYSLKSTPKELAQGRSNGVAFYDQSTLRAPLEIEGNETPIGRIMTSNNADLPPLTGVSVENAKELCGLYEVDLVFEKDEPANSLIFIRQGLKKRLLQRREFLASNLWPEAYDKIAIDYLEGVKDPTLEPSSPRVTNYTLKDKQCVHTPPSAPPLTRWQELSRLIHGTSPVAGGVNVNDRGVKLGGRCFSRFGIQHLVGNVEEINSDQLFCSYNEMQLRFGRSFFDEAINALKQTPDPYYFSLDIPEAIHEGSYIYVSSKLMVYEGDPMDPSTEPKPLPEDFMPYSLNDTNSGYCSVVGAEADHRDALKGDGLTFETYSFTSFLGQLIKELNRLIIPNYNKIADKEAVASYRDGEGYFLDFGDKHMAQSLVINNSLGLPWEFDTYDTLATGSVTPARRANNLYFSSLLGLPLNCGKNDTGKSSTCLEHYPNLVEERTFGSQGYSFSTEDNDESLEAPPTIADFYVGGSKISNTGLSNLTRVRDVRTKDSNQATYIAGIQLLVPGIDPLSFTLDKKDYGITWKFVKKSTKDLPEGEEVILHRIRWAIQQTFDSKRNKLGQDFRFFSGGSGSFPEVKQENIPRQMNGRFSLNISLEQPSKNRGLRCVVKINEVD